MEQGKIEQNVDIEPPQKMGGVGFYIIATFAIIKDALDIFLFVSIVLYIVSVMLSVVISIIIWMYYFYNNVGFIDKYGSKKFVIFICCSLLEIPAGFLPLTTFSLFTVRTMENHERFRKFVHTFAELKDPRNIQELLNLAAKNLSIPDKAREDIISASKSPNNDDVSMATV